MTDYESAEKMAGAVGNVVRDVGGPMGIIGRLAGMGQDEVEAGVPGWAWFGIGLVAGAAVMYSLHDKAKAVIEA